MIQFFVAGQVLKVAQPTIVSDTIDYLEAECHFQTADWANTNKWVHFKKGEQSYSIPLTEDRISKSAHLNLSAGDWEVYLHGTSENGMRITTQVQRLTVLPSGVLDGQPMGEVPLSPAEQIEQKADNAVKIAQSVRDDADSGKFNGKPGAQGAPGEKGEPGTPGKTPEKGVDYWTPEDEEKLNTATEAKQTAHRAFSLAQTNEEDIRVNEIDITALKNTSIRMQEERVADANQYTSHMGYAKTSDQTRNLPVSGADAWGVILFLPENMGTKVGVQIYYPVDKAKKGTVWVRTSNRSNFSPWRQLAMVEDISAFEQEVQAVKSEITLLKSANTKHTNDIVALQQEIEQLKQQITPKP